MKKFLLSLLFSLSIMTTQAQYLLDQIGTSPSVAFSLRLLKSTYTGPLVRIKVGSSFYDVYPDASTTKFSLGSKISAAISTYNAAAAVASANALSSIITPGTTNATVAIWYDQSGNGVHVLSNGSSPGAKIITAGSINTIFGQPTIYFSGSDSKLGSSSTVDYSALSGATVNAVAQNIATTSGYAGIIGTANAGTYPGYNISYTSGVGYQSDGDGCGYRTSVNSTDPKIVTNIFINNTTNLSKIYVNNELKTNVAVTSGTCALSHTSGSKIFIGVSRGFGSASTFIGNISEAIIFPSQLSDAVRNPLETNQSQTYLGPAVTIASSASGAVCAGTSVTFTATTYNFTGTPTYQWYKNSVAINGETSATYTTSTLANADQIYAIASAVTSNSLTANITSGPSAVVTVSGDGCINKTTLSTPAGLTSYAWYKDNAPISGAISNTYTPTTAGDYKVQVTSGTCSTMSAATTISVCGVTGDGRMRSIATPTTLVSQEGGINFGTGVSEAGKTVNATGLTTTVGTISATTAVVSGVISSTNALTSSIGVIYSTDSNFGTFSTSSTQSNVASGTYAFTLSGLSSTTPYYAKSFIVNKAGTSYGAVISFTTLAVVPTLAATTAASAIAGTTATSGGNVSADGGSAVTARGIVWGTATNPTIDLTTKSTDGTGTGVFTSSLTGLTAATLYYVRSYATNAIGTSYGAEISFTTLDVVSTVTSPYTNKVWMDRNLGATRVAQSVNDTEAYGDLYQWGRAKDGGQLRNAPQVATRLTDISSRSTNSISAQPWTSQANWNSQTGGVWDVKPWNSNTDGGVNNPCPTGFRVPSDSEWTAELNGMIGAGLVTTTTGVFNSFLKIPQAGVIEGSGFSGTVITTKSVYWTTDRLDGYSSREIRFSPSLNAERNANWYSFRYSVRCIAQ